MIVDEPPYELVALFADQDARQLFEALIERGQNSGCLRKFRWRSLRDPRRDVFVRRPADDLSPFVRDSSTRFMLLWDHQGSGVEDNARRIEDDVVEELKRAGVATNRVLAVSLVPELEELFAPVWERVLVLLAAERKRSVPSTDVILRFAQAMDPSVAGDASSERTLHPKEMLRGALKALQLRSSASIYGMLGEKLSIRALKDAQAARRIAEKLIEWFPPGTTESSEP